MLIRVFKEAMHYKEARLTFIVVVILCIGAFFVPKFITNMNISNLIVMTMAIVVVYMSNNLSKFLIAVRDQLEEEDSKKK